MCDNSREEKRIRKQLLRSRAVMFLKDVKRLTLSVMAKVVCVNRLENETKTTISHDHLHCK